MVGIVVLTHVYVSGPFSCTVDDKASERAWTVGIIGGAVLIVTVIYDIARLPRVVQEHNEKVLSRVVTLAPTLNIRDGVGLQMRIVLP